MLKQKRLAMTARYIRVSTTTQNTARQERSNKEEIQFIDRVSGTMPFSERPQAKLLLDAITDGKVDKIIISSIDRLGRNTIDVLTTIEKLHKLHISLFVENLGLHSLVHGKENSVFALLSSIMSTLATLERNTMLERQREGILLAKAKGTYKGRDKGTKETDLVFLAKYKNVISYLQKDLPPTLKEIAKLCDSNITTVQKVKKVLKNQIHQE